MKQISCISCGSNNIEQTHFLNESYSGVKNYVQCTDCKSIFKKNHCSGCDQIFDGENIEHSANIQFSFGYNSNHGGTCGSFDFCQNCAESFMKDFKEKYPALKFKNYIFSSDGEG